MSDLLVRTFKIEVEPGAGDGRIIHARCVPYGVETMVRDSPDQEPYLETFARGAFAKATRAPDRVTLNFRHGPGVVDLLGRALTFAEQDDGLHGELRVVAGSIGDHALALVDDGVLTGVSVGFAPLSRREKRTASGAIIRDRCHLEEVSLVPTPAYAGAVVTGRRDGAGPPAPVVDVDALRPARDDAQLERLRSVGIEL